MIQVTCPKCGRVSEAPEKMLGQTLYCAGCQSPMKISAPAAAAGVPPAAPAEPEKNPLRMADRNQSASGGSLCPHCGILKPDPGSVCGQCGFDPRTGVSAADRYQSRKTMRRALRWVLLLAALALAGAAVWWGQRPTESDEGEEGLWARVKRGVGVTPKPAPLVSPERKKAIRNTLVEKFDRDYPMLGTNEEIDFEMTTGRVLRGFSKPSASPGVLTYAGEDQVERSVPYDQLRPLSRIRLDAEFRTEFIEEQIQQEIIAEELRARTPPPAN